MNVIMFLYLAVLAFLLTPGVLLRLPPGGSPVVVAVTHALVLSLVYGLSSKMIFKLVA
jgi:hypothetical protein